MMPPSFTLTETFALGGHSYSWRLKEGQIRFRGRGRYAGLVDGRIPASDDQIARINDAYWLLGVWDWQDNYSPQELGVEFHDGSHWSFDVEVTGQNNHSAGWNAYPSFADPKITSWSRDRFDLLVAAIYSCFQIDDYLDRQNRIRTNPE